VYSDPQNDAQDATEFFSEVKTTGGLKHLWYYRIDDKVLNPNIDWSKVVKKSKNSLENSLKRDIFKIGAKKNMTTQAIKKSIDSHFDDLPASVALGLLLEGKMVGYGIVTQEEYEQEIVEAYEFNSSPQLITIHRAKKGEHKE